MLVVTMVVAAMVMIFLCLGGRRRLYWLGMVILMASRMIVVRQSAMGMAIAGRLLTLVEN